MSYEDMSKISMLEAELEHAMETIERLQSERDEARDDADRFYLEREKAWRKLDWRDKTIDALRRELRQARQGRDNWRDASKQLRAELDRIRGEDSDALRGSD